MKFAVLLILVLTSCITNVQQVSQDVSSQQGIQRGKNPEAPVNQQQDTTNSTNSQPTPSPVQNSNQTPDTPPIPSPQNTNNQFASVSPSTISPTTPTATSSPGQAPKTLPITVEKTIEFDRLSQESAAIAHMIWNGSLIIYDAKDSLYKTFNLASEVREPWYTFSGQMPSGLRGNPLTWDGTHFWSTDGSTIYQHLPNTGKVVHTVKPKQNESTDIVFITPKTLTWNESSLWFAGSVLPKAKKLFKLDPQSGLIQKSLMLDLEPEALVHNGQSLWLVHFDHVWKVAQMNPETGEILGEFISPGADTDTGSCPLRPSVAWNGSNLLLAECYKLYVIKVK